MKLSDRQRDAIEDLEAIQVEAIKTIFGRVLEKMGDEVLGVSIGRGEADIEKVLVYEKCRLEGAAKAERLLIQELQAVRNSASKRVAS